MTILVRDEADIIEANIRFHAAQGVDCFAVMDNGSTDGTSEILEKLSAEFDLHIIKQEETNYQQARWMTELAFYAKNKLKADLVISNDADEFWLPEEGTSLKDHLNSSDSVVTVTRCNMALTEECTKSDYRFYDASYVIENPIQYDRKCQLNNAAVSMLLVTLSPKTIVNPYGLYRIKGGNHRAKHVWKSLNARTEPNITVYHYPIRSYKQFEANITNRQRLLKETNASMGSHYKRWVSLYEKGELPQEFQKFILSDGELKTTCRLGVTRIHTRVGQKISESMNQ